MEMENSNSQMTAPEAAPASIAPAAAPAAPQYATPDDLSRAYQGFQGSVDSKMKPIQDQLGQLQSTLQALTPLQRLAEAMSPQTQAQSNPVLDNPIQALMEMHTRNAEQARAFEAMKADYEQFKNDSQAQHIAGIKERELTEAFAQKLDPETLERAKTLASTVHKEQFKYLYAMNNGNVADAFSQYLDMLKSGHFKTQDPNQAAQLVNQLTRAETMRNKAMVSSMGNPNGGMGSNGNGRGNNFDLAAITF